MPAFLPKTNSGPEGFGGLLLPIAVVQIAAPFAWLYAAWQAARLVPVIGLIPDRLKAPAPITLDTRQIVVGGCVVLAVLGLLALVQMLRRRPSSSSLYMAEVILALALAICGGKLLAWLQGLNVWEVLPHMITLVADGFGILSMAYVMFSIRCANTFSRERRQPAIMAASKDSLS